MKTTLRCIAAALTLASAHTGVMAQPIPIVGLVELSGSGATAGINYDNGVKLAVSEINAAAGILGRKINYSSWDTQTQPGIAKSLATKAIDQGVPLVMGPVFSGSILVRFLCCRHQGQAVQRRRTVYLFERGRVRPVAERAAQAGLRQTHHR